MKLVTLGILFIVCTFSSLYASTHEEANALVAKSDTEMVSQEVAAPSSDYTQEQKKWYKRGMFWFGCMNGFSLPLPYAVAISLNLIDTSHPAMQETIQPFIKGAFLGVGMWFIWTMIKWYFELAALRSLNSALKNPVINKVIRETIHDYQQPVGA